MVHNGETSLMQMYRYKYTIPTKYANTSNL